MSSFLFCCWCCYYSQFHALYINICKIWANSKAQVIAHTSRVLNCALVTYILLTYIMLHNDDRRCRTDGCSLTSYPLPRTGHWPTGSVWFLFVPPNLLNIQDDNQLSSTWMGRKKRTIWCRNVNASQNLDVDSLPVFEQQICCGLHYLYRNPLSNVGHHH